MSSNVGGMAAHWTAACPRPGGSERIPFLPDLDELLDEAERLLGVTTRRLRRRPVLGPRPRNGSPPPWTRAGTPAYRVQPMPLAVHRREDGGLVWSGSDVVMGDVTRENPQFELLRRVAGDARARRGRPRCRHRSPGPPQRRNPPGARPLRRGGRGCPAHAAAAVGFRHPARRPGPLPQRPGAGGVRERLRDRHGSAGPGSRQRRAQRAERRCLGALHGRGALPRPDHAAGRVPGSLGRR